MSCLEPQYSTVVRHCKIVDRSTRPATIEEYWLVNLIAKSEQLTEWLHERNINYRLKSEYDGQCTIWVFDEMDAMMIKLEWMP